MTSYVTLVASLPHLPHFERAKRLPINRARLDQRLGMLTEGDRDQLAAAEKLLRWQHQALDRPDTAIVERFESLTARDDLPDILAGFVAKRMDVRLITAALRRRRARLGPPSRPSAWDRLPLMRRIRGTWDEPDFGLRSAHPWIPQARRLLDEGDAIGLERYLMNLIWHWLEERKAPEDFGFDAVIVYVFQWDLVARWLTHEAGPAAARFTALVEEATGEHVHLFA